MKDERTKPQRPPPKEEPHPFERFKEFARRIVSVPKSEIEEREQEYRSGREKTQRDSLRP